MSRRTVTVIAGVLVLALVLSGAIAALSALTAGDDTVSENALAAPPARAPASADPDAADPPEPELADVYAQELSWGPCGDGGGSGTECATLEVPLDYADAAGEIIELALLRVPAARPEERAGSLVVNPGGPGAPGTSYAAAAGDVFRDRLTDYFDIVGFDPRGTGSSSPVDCLSDDELDTYLAGDPDPDTPAEATAYAEQTRALGLGCVERSGDLASHVSTVEAARDMDVLRAVLGQGTLDYFGASYGTKLGATYAELFPTRVGRFVLDGAVDPTLTNRDLNLQQAAGFETALRAYVANCVEETDDCFLGADVDAGMATIAGLVTSVDEAPLETGTRRPLTVGNAFYGIVAPLYNRDYWVLLSQALRTAIDGDGALLLQLSDAYSSRGPDGFADNSTEANYAINCLDDPSSITAADVPSQLAEFEAAAPTFGDVFAWSLTTCSGVQARASEPAPVIDADGAAPILVVGTSRDPATPYAWAVELAGQLESGVLLSRDGDGHTAYNAGNECIDETVEAYLVDDVVPEDGRSC